MKSHHTIKTIIAEVEIDSKQEAHEMQNKMSQMCRDHFIPMMDQIFSEWSPTDQSHRIDQLEIDLGEFAPRFSDEELIKEFQNELGGKLEQHFTKHPMPENPAFSSHYEEIRDPINNSPFSAKGFGRENDLGGEFEKEFGENFEKAFEEEYFSLEGNLISHEDSFDASRYPTPHTDASVEKYDPPSFRRDEDLVAYFLKTGLLPWWCDRSPHFLKSAIDRVLTQSEVVPRLLLSDDRVLQRILYQFNEEQISFLIEEQTHYLGEGFAQFLANGFQFLKELERTEAILLKDFQRELWEVVLVELTLDQKGRFDESLLIANLLEGWKLSPKFSHFSNLVVERKKEKKAREQSSFAKIIETILEKQIKDNKNLPPVQENWQRESEPTMFPSAPKAGTNEFDDSEMIYISNGGLALIDQLIPDLFAELGLLKEGLFYSEESLFKAVYLLQYLVTGEEEVYEYDLALNKLMCGMDLTEPIESKIELSPIEKEACQNLLKKALQLFPHLQGMIAEDFQTVFLQRQAALSVRDRCWLLRVEPEGRDILLKNFPWEHLRIHYSWMIDSIEIEWGVDYHSEV